MPLRTLHHCRLVYFKILSIINHACKVLGRGLGKVPDVYRNECKPKDHRSCNEEPAPIIELDGGLHCPLYHPKLVFRLMFDGLCGLHYGIQATVLAGSKLKVISKRLASCVNGSSETSHKDDSPSAASNVEIFMIEAGSRASALHKR